MADGGPFCEGPRRHTGIEENIYILEKTEKRRNINHNVNVIIIYPNDSKVSVKIAYTISFI